MFSSWRKSRARRCTRSSYLPIGRWTRRLWRQEILVLGRIGSVILLGRCRYRRSFRLGRLATMTRRETPFDFGFVHCGGTGDGGRKRQALSTLLLLSFLVGNDGALFRSGATASQRHGSVGCKGTVKLL
jgi:hypothetical protein